MGNHRKHPPCAVNQAFSKLVRERREALGMSQLDLAVTAGVSVSRVDYVEGGGGATVRNALPVARALGINLMDLP